LERDLVSEPLQRPLRRFLGTAHSWSERVRVYWTDEALEVDRIDHYELHRRRVFFDEILLVTLHSARGGGALPWSLVILIAFLGLVTFIAALSEQNEVALGFLIPTGVLVVAALTLFLLPSWVVTVFGKRTRARMRFALRQAKAREVYAAICRAASDAQRALAGRLAAEEPAPPPLPPLPLSDSELPSEVPESEEPLPFP
jgi:hypothetical protein